VAQKYCQLSLIEVAEILSALADRWPDSDEMLSAQLIEVAGHPTEILSDRRWSNVKILG
jgi:hypothetical protein